jgi:hypothetical protein
MQWDFCMSDQISGNGVCGYAAGFAALPHGLRASQSTQVGGLHCKLAIFSDSAAAIMQR